MRKLSVSLVFIFLEALNAHAAWIEKEARSENSPAHGLIHQYLVLEDSETGERASIELALFATKLFTLRIIDQPAEPRVDLAVAMQRAKCLAGVNGGYFDPDYKPVGLLIADGRLISPFVQARLLSGVLAVKDGRIQIFRSGEFARRTKWAAAVQCGPFLVERGKAVAGLEATRSARRTFVSVGGNQAALGFCSPVSLADLGRILATPGIGGNFTIQRAINLDGGSSSAFWFRGKTNGEEFAISPQKSVRDFVAIVPR